MVLEIEKKALIRALTRISGAVGGILPICDSVKIEVDELSTRFTATDLQMTIVATEQAQGEGAALLPFKTLFDTIRLIPDDVVRIQATDGKAIIETSTGKYRFATDDLNNFPTSNFAGDKMQRVDTAQFIGAIEKALPFTDPPHMDQLRPALSGVNFAPQDDGTHVVATDAHKLSLITLPGVRLNFIMPRKMAAALKAQGGLSEYLFVNWNDKQVSVMGGGVGTVEIISTLIDARYPDYKAVIPKAHDKALIIDRAALLGALKRISVYANKQSNMVVFSAGAVGVNVRAFDNDMQTDAAEDFDATKWTYEGAPIQIGFNGKYVQEVVNAIGTDRVRIQMSTPDRAAVVIDELNLFLLMPVMLT